MYIDNACVSAGTVLIDAHAHLYPCYDLEFFLASAAANFQCAARTLKREHTSAGCLLLAESEKTTSLRKLASTQESLGFRGWRFTTTDEKYSFQVFFEDQRALYVVLGSQLVSREGVELLVFPSMLQHPSPRTLWDLLESAWRDSSITILPWGFGKWSFFRHRVVVDVLERYRHEVASTYTELFLGDSSNRPDMLEPRLLRRESGRGIRILPGTDPLPFVAETGRSGTCGLVLSGPWDEAKPWDSIKKLLHENPAQPETYRRACGLIDFGRFQIAMQLRKFGKHR